jgi:hypothetical protein
MSISGVVTSRPRRMFTDADLIDFIERKSRREAVGGGECMSPSHWVGAFAWWSMSGIIGAFIGGWAAGLLAEGAGSPNGALHGFLSWAVTHRGRGLRSYDRSRYWLALAEHIFQSPGLTEWSGPPHFAQRSCAESCAMVSPSEMRGSRLIGLNLITRH